MDPKTRLERLQYLRRRHAAVHDTIEALEGEKAPEESVLHQKKIKLSIKDEITAIEASLKSEGVKYVS